MNSPHNIFKKEDFNCMSYTNRFPLHLDFGKLMVFQFISARYDTGVSYHEINNFCKECGYTSCEHALRALLRDNLIKMVGYTKHKSKEYPIYASAYTKNEFIQKVLQEDLDYFRILYGDSITPSSISKNASKLHISQIDIVKRRPLMISKDE